MLGSIYIPIQQPKPPSAQLVRQYASGWLVESAELITNLTDRTVTFTGNAKATYGPTTVTADRFVVHDDPDNPYAEATGHVHLTDPDGTVDATYLKFYGKSHKGTAQNVDVKVSMLRLTAESVEIKPDLWILRNVGGTGCQLRTPVYYIHTRELQIKPGLYARAIKPELSLFGHKLLKLPNETMHLGGGGTSIDVPYPTYRNNHWGINWTNTWPLNDQTGLFTKYAIFQKTLPFYNATVMRSGITGQDPETLRTEIGDRFTFGYFDSIQVRDFASEERYLKDRRFNIGLSSTFGADARDTTTSQDKINKPIEALGEASGNVGGFGAFGLFRAQQVRVGDGPTVNRLILEQNLRTPTLRLGSAFSAFARADAAEYDGGNHYGWVRGQTGLVFQPTPNVRFGASYSSARQYGQPDFAYDAPLKFREATLRADLDFDTTQIRVMIKYDPSARAVFDREFYVSRVIGCIEPYVVYRERPHKFFLGIKLPINRVFDRLSKEALERDRAMRQSIGGSP